MWISFKLAVLDGYLAAEKYILAVTLLKTDYNENLKGWMKFRMDTYIFDTFFTKSKYWKYGKLSYFLWKLC